MIGDIAAYFVIYLLFNVGIPTWIRFLDMGDDSYTRKQWLISIIPVVGLLYAIFLIFKSAWNEH